MHEDSCKNGPSFPWLPAPPLLRLEPLSTFPRCPEAQSSWGSAERKRPAMPPATQHLCMQINTPSLRGPCALDPNTEMEISSSSSTIAEQQLRRQEGQSNTNTDVAKQSLISSEEWLQLHGLKSNKLTLKQILSQIGFPHCEAYVTSLGRFVASRYADGLFPRVYRAEDGTAYNLTAKSELICQFVEHLKQAVESYEQRINWLTSRSRQVFGVILEQCIAIVLDLGDMRKEELSLCQDALTMVLEEQVALIAKFNIIRASREPVKWQENAAPAMEQSIAAAISWVEKLTFEQALSQASRLDALQEAGKDRTIESVYYFVVGDIPEESKQLLLQRVLEMPCPVCTVSFNARGEGTVAFLKDLSAKAHGRFHAFAERTEYVGFPASSLKDGDSVVTSNSRKLKGKPPPGAGVREDVFLIWREMEEACSTLAQIQRLVAEPSKSDMATTESESGTTSVGSEPNPEDMWDSKKWLQKYGLKAQKLSFYDVLADCSFRHADGVVDIKAKPENESIQTSAETNRKTVHAKYCSRFVHAPWKDGSLVHVCVTKEKCTWYTERIHAVLAQIRRRIEWLQAGSRILFGKVYKDCVYILIDTSHSMKGKLDLVKDKIIQFMQEQLKFKRKFNFVQFDAHAVAWRERLVDINEDNLQGARSWVRNMKVGSSTNTLHALQVAFADKETQAIYLLTDGRPDQPPEMVIDQVKVFQKIPIYTISFNYNDKMANDFLKELASLTGGEFHSYQLGPKDACPPKAEQNEDLTLLIKEMEQGRSDLEKMQNLYSESLIMDWWYNGEKEGDRHHVGMDGAKREGMLNLLEQEMVLETFLSVAAVFRALEVCPGKYGGISGSLLAPEATKTSLLRSQMCTLKSVACSRKTDDLPTPSSWNPPGDRGKAERVSVSEPELSILLTNEYLDDISLERPTPEGSHPYDQEKLTIMDALSATAVPHSPTYIPILGKHVTSKVFDEKAERTKLLKCIFQGTWLVLFAALYVLMANLGQVFPLAHVCNDTNKMTLINPQGVKLNVYKQKVEQAIKSYEKRLNKIVWRALSQEEKEKLDANKPMRYLENKAALNEALERLNWPISLKELSMLENEILAGKMYIQQAMELQEAAMKEDTVSRAPAEPQKFQGNSTKKIKSKKLHHLKGQRVIARCDANGFYFPGRYFIL
ncbi:von Willebrand factor A domain-containing protein 3B [Myotis davidii]|uniref:von Willebrand factor A domain-containing protein 3B n=1 Tax=Myotis davidii TaxID=225400 RepID=L5LAI0_MYODS|nr:von Willebrand factor A domain-containing protein 3B [Myotis davidii]